jgi:Cu-Zn family superoxide dismutase
MKIRILFTSAVLSLAVISCLVAANAAAQTASTTDAIAVVHPASGSQVKGTVRFQATGKGVQVVADLEGLTPGAKHGFHIHEFGDCSSADATSAGSHYDPEGTKHHGQPHDPKKHAGDLGNLEADKAGKAHYEITMPGLSINGAQNPILGRAVIVHAKPDVFTQPVGDAGGRIGCGIIGIAKSAAK